MAKREDRYAVGQKVKELVDGTAEALKEMLQPVEMPPEISDAQIKQAILDITPDAYMTLSPEAKNFITEFTQRRKF